MNKLPRRNPHPIEWYGCLALQFLAPFIIMFSGFAVELWAIIPLVMFGIATEVSEKRVEKLNTLADHLDAPVTDWPLMSLDQFKWMVWNCGLRGREITSEEVVDYYIFVLKGAWMRVNGVSCKNDGFEHVADSRLSVGIIELTEPKSDYELIEEPRPVQPIKIPQARI